MFLKKVAFNPSRKRWRNIFTKLYLFFVSSLLYFCYCISLLYNC